MLKTFKAMATSVLISTILVGTANAVPEFQRGKATRVALFDDQGSFIVTLNNTTLDDCQYKYVYFYVSDLGEVKVQRAYEMALRSVTSGVDMGVVIDKDTNGVGGQCRAIGMAAELRANW